MSCANVLLTVAAAAAFIFGVWPLAGTAASPWIVGVAAIVIIVIAWTGVGCKWCEAAKAVQKKPAKK
jgi:hypothetical protein